MRIAVTSAVGVAAAVVVADAGAFGIGRRGALCAMRVGNGLQR